MKYVACENFLKSFFKIYIYIALCYIRSSFLYIHLLLQLMKIILCEKISRRYKTIFFIWNFENEFEKL